MPKDASPCSDAEYEGTEKVSGNGRGPSLEIQQQIDSSIAARSAGIHRGALQPDFGDGNNRDAALEAGIPPAGAQFEYLDHPADVVLHAWGADLPASLGSLALCMFGYMTSLDAISIDESQSAEHGAHITAQGHDLHSLIFSYLDEWLFNFHDTGFVPKEVTVSDFCRESLRIVSSGKGEIMDIRRHPQGTEVKAITYSGMRVAENDERTDVFVVVDI
ncbi:hypothetical protein ACHAXT_009774 [Thalassiosira profunda]